MVQQWINNGEEWDDNGVYPLVMTNIAMVKPWPIEIDGLPGFTVLKNGWIFPWLS